MRALQAARSVRQPSTGGDLGSNGDQAEAGLGGRSASSKVAGRSAMGLGLGRLLSRAG